VCDLTTTTAPTVISNPYWHRRNRQ